VAKKKSFKGARNVQSSRGWAKNTPLNGCRLFCYFWNQKPVLFMLGSSHSLRSSVDVSYFPKRGHLQSLTVSLLCQTPVGENHHPSG